MNFKKIIADIRKDLKKNVNEKYRIGSTRFFKETIKPYGVYIPKVRKIADKHYKVLKDKLKLKDFLDLTEELFKTGWFEEPIIGLHFLAKLKKQFTISTFKTFEKWIKKYISNWAHCDLLCTALVYPIVIKNPQLLKTLHKWTTSKNRWVVRASAVTLVVPAKKGLFKKDCLSIAKKLKLSKDDLVLKGTGWMLRECAKNHRKEVYNFLLKNKDSGRVMLRYAIEHFPQTMRKKVLS